MSLSRASCVHRLKFSRNAYRELCAGQCAPADTSLEYRTPSKRKALAESAQIRRIIVGLYCSAESDTVRGQRI